MGQFFWEKTWTVFIVIALFFALRKNRRRSVTSYPPPSFWTPCKTQFGDHFATKCGNLFATSCPVLCCTSPPALTSLSIVELISACRRKTSEVKLLAAVIPHPSSIRRSVDRVLHLALLGGHVLLEHVFRDDTLRCFSVYVDLTFADGTHLVHLRPPVLVVCSSMS